jgi:hypothetical protein
MRQCIRSDLIAGEEEPCLRDSLYSTEEFGGCAIVNRNHHDTCQHAAPQRGHPFRTILTPKEDFVPLPYARGGETPGENSSGVRGFPVRIPARPVAVEVSEKRFGVIGEGLEKI